MRIPCDDAAPPVPAMDRPTARSPAGFRDRGRVQGRRCQRYHHAQAVDASLRPVILLCATAVIKLRWPLLCSNR